MSVKTVKKLDVAAVFEGNNALDGRRFRFTMTQARARYLLSLLSDVKIDFNQPLTDWQEAHLDFMLVELGRDG